MWWRIFAKIAGWTVLQVLFFLLLHKIAFDLIAEHRGYTRPDLGYRISVHYSLYVMYLLCVFNGTMKVISTGFMLPSQIVALICTIVWVLLWLGALDSYPYRTALMITAGITTFSIPVLFNYWHHYFVLNRSSTT
jgi:hypothetical protein